MSLLLGFHVVGFFLQIACMTIHVHLLPNPRTLPPTLPLSHAVSKLSKVADCQPILASLPAVLSV